MQMNKYNSESYAKQVHTPAKRAVEGDRAVIFSASRFVQSCLVMPPESKQSSKIALFDSRRTMACLMFTRGFVMSIEPTAEIMYKQLFKKK